MGKCIQVCNTWFIPSPHTFPSGIFEAGIVSFTFCAEWIVIFKIPVVPVDRKTQVIRNGNIFGASTIFFPLKNFGCFIGQVRTTCMDSRIFALYDFGHNIFRHGSWQDLSYRQECQLAEVLCLGYLREWYIPPLIKRMNLIIDVFNIIPFVSKKGTFLYG